MKKRGQILALMLVLVMMMAINVFAVDTQAAKEDMRGVWVCSVYNLDYPVAPTIDEETLKAQADRILDNTAAMGLNTVFLQVRPSSDALYSSDIFPWSKYLTGAQGTAPKNGFDPLLYWVDGAHARGLELHAWINPYRITKGKDAEWNQLSASNPAKLHPEWVKKYTDGNYYYDPAIPEVRQLVVDGVMEILNRYSVDGIHLDDYFYPGTDFDDADSFQKYNNGYQIRDDWRRENVNQLVRALDEKIHAKSSDLRFGISPSGIWENKCTDSRGSDTNGGHPSYSKCYADSLQWIREGSIDYIVPQIYWHIGLNVADYETLVRWWSEAVENSQVQLYIGEAAYKCDVETEYAQWQGTNGAAELKKHLNLCQGNQNVSGHVYFRYGSFLTAAGVKSIVTDYYHNIDKQDTQQETKSQGSQQQQQAVQSNMGKMQTLLLFLQAIIR